jgi:pilus assembly protein Flp/PilA
MSNARRLLAQFWSDEDGHSSIEYALIATIISIVAVSAMTVIGTRVNVLFSGVLPGLG